MPRVFVAFLVVWGLIASNVALVRSPGTAAGTSREGCLQEWLFNGVWRMQVAKVEPYMDGPRQAGWQVTEIWRNGTSQPLHPADSFLHDQTLTLANRVMPATGSTTGTLSLQSLAANGFAPAGQFTYKQIFLGDVDAANKPKTIDVTFDAARLAQVKTRPQLTTSQYNYHVNLECTSTGETSLAQGGSTQVNAREGCLGEWMTNGVWKMRVTGVVPRHLGPDDPTSAQVGWLVTQEWVNPTPRRLLPGSLPSGPAVDTNVSDEYLITESGNNASSSNTAGNMQALTLHEFAPGASFTYQQLFGWTPFDAKDKPTRVLVTFDDKRQNGLANHPHYTAPANFRINLACTK